MKATTGSDTKQRVEVAERLRNLPTDVYKSSFVAADAQGKLPSYIYDAMEGWGPFIAADAQDDVGYSMIYNAVFGHSGSDYNQLRNCLANLIDPTCEVSSVEPIEDEVGLTDGWEFHLTCGHRVVRPYNEVPSYCIECGARVVSDTEHAD